MVHGHSRVMGSRKTVAHPFEEIQGMVMRQRITGLSNDTQPFFCLAEIERRRDPETRSTLCNAAAATSSSL
jgi:hypothetical protein